VATGSPDYDVFGIAVARRYVADEIPEPAGADWACSLIPTVTLEAVMAWLTRPGDSGRPHHHAHPGNPLGRCRPVRRTALLTL
jgi:hypothetical protein